MWQRYYEVKLYTIENTNLQYLRVHGKWFIFHGEDSATPGKAAYDVGYRTQRLAERGAERLYRRKHGAFEEAVLGS